MHENGCAYSSLNTLRFCCSSYTVDSFLLSIIIDLRVWGLQPCKSSVYLAAFLKAMCAQKHTCYTNADTAAQTILCVHYCTQPLKRIWRLGTHWVQPSTCLSRHKVGRQEREKLKTSGHPPFIILYCLADPFSLTVYVADCLPLLSQHTQHLLLLNTNII